MNIYGEEAKQSRETDNMRERQKENTQSKNRETTEVVGDTQLPFEPTEKGNGTHNSQYALCNLIVHINSACNWHI